MSLVAVITIQHRVQSIVSNSGKIIYSYFCCTSIRTVNMNIKTFVFMDSETTGLPYEENNRTRMTELCLTAVQSEHLSLGVFPRIQNKVNLCFNPQRLINPNATKITGLSNELLEYQPNFDSNTFPIIQNFLYVQRTPVCLVAHNGYRFDFPIFRAEINNTGNKLPENVLCVDSLVAFKELQYEDIESSKENVQEVAHEKVPIEFQDGYDELLCNVVDKIESVIASTSKKLTIAEIQAANECTPKKQCINGINTPCTKVKVNKNNHIANFGTNLSYNATPSFKLGDIYKRITSKEPTEAHKAEHDVSMLIECAAALGQRFVDWSNFNAKNFCDIPMMIPGKKFGS